DVGGEEGVGRGERGRESAHGGDHDSSPGRGEPGVEPGAAEDGGGFVEVVGVDGDVDDLSADLLADGVDGVVGDDGSTVEDDDAVGELLDLVEALAGDEHGGPAV